MAGLADKADALASSLSGGQKKRLCFALSVVGNPDILFLDEPTAALDIGAQHSFRQQVSDFARLGKTIVMTSHNLEHPRRLPAQRRAEHCTVSSCLPRRHAGPRGRGCSERLGAVGTRGLAAGLHRRVSGPSSLGVSARRGRELPMNAFGTELLAAEPFRAELSSARRVTIRFRSGSGCRECRNRECRNITRLPVLGRTIQLLDLDSAPQDARSLATLTRSARRNLQRSPQFGIGP